VARFASVIAQTAYPVFVAAMGMLAASAALDQIQDFFPTTLTGRGFCEDAAKLLGIGTWLSYAIHTCAALLRREQAWLHTPLEQPKMMPPWVAGGECSAPDAQCPTADAPSARSLSRCRSSPQI
jgi:hypothetical protein